ncbi:alpha-2-macroglobulin family protein [Devosia sp. BSSL-BM10]|uniref:Alpha-2-macroglobulin family protein n=1 Tax=Devosia litorisediminis TaxID=2829817 RepID=A0A942IEX6_9HYPH|nr:alpha-2-macroglobulin family protein [Devosia litorisediminis]MBS3850179.1 alpha-2-macroglobulin family protein [Devosia litorisediminis]
MRHGLGVIRFMGAALILALGMAQAQAADPKITLLQDSDLPGYDYAILKNTDLDACSASCADDRICQAFTFNQKSNWCFLKGAVGEPTAFKGAVSGTIEHAPSPAALSAIRQSEIPFPAQDLIDAARRFANELPQTDAPPPKVGYADLVADGDAASAAQNPAGAITAYRQALAINPNAAHVWQALAIATLTRAEAVAGADNDNSGDLARTAVSAALNAFLRAEETDARALALRALANGMEYGGRWREVIATYRLSQQLWPSDDVAAHLQDVVAQHGFRVVNHVVDAEAAAPRICAVFSDPLGSTDLSAYVVVANAPQTSVETEADQICVEGVSHGSRYAIKLRAGLPSADGETLGKEVDLDIYVPDRSPFVGFANNAYVMPAGLGGGLPITSINADTAELQIYRIGDRGVAAAVRDGIFQGNLTDYGAQDIADRVGQQVWSGEIDLARGQANILTTTAIPVADALGNMEPGAYVVTARIKGEVDDEYWSEKATQWFIITDLGLTSIAGDDGVHAFVRGLTDAQPVANATVRLIAVNNDVLGQATTDETGRARFAPGLARGTGGAAPQLLVAETTDGDYAFLDLSKPAFDLTDRGVEGRPSPGPLDLFATTERGVYRPGETVFLTALLRDDRAAAVSGLPLTMEVERPDGVVASTQLLSDQGAGGYFTALPMVEGAMRGSWTLRLYSDPNADALASTSFLVEDFEPERLAFVLSTTDQAPLVTDEVTEISVAAKYLYGATAPDLDIEADAVIRPVKTLEGFPGYTFGRLDDTMETTREPLGVVGTTDQSGHAVAEVVLPAVQTTTRPLQAQILLRLVDTNGRTIERSLSRPVMADTDRIGIKPVFADPSGLSSGSEAQFDIIAVSPQGETVAKTGLNWTLSRLETTYQWYRNGSAWQWEPITTTRTVASGTLDTPQDGPATIGANVDWGRYQIEVTSTAPGATSSSYDFYAGYYYADAGSDTPDTLQVALDKPAYRVGETARLKLDPQFAGTALVMVVDNRVIAMQAVNVPKKGTTVDLEVTDDWGPGAYVTAILYRPADTGEKRMPSRALGLAFADVEPGDRKLDVSLDAPQTTLPRQSFTTGIALGNLAAGQTAYVAVAAVDLGILNLTNFKTPSPDDWYFGQRQLGMDIRDLYGSLIDPTQGMAGAMRSGGDGGAARLGNPPPISVLVALHSGIVELDSDGKASVTFDMPDFSGTVRVMAMAWTDTAVGHAQADVIVRDPVVVTLSPPRFLRVDDASRLLVEINNIDGAAGAYGVSLSTGTGINTTAQDTEVTLDKGARTTLELGLTGAAIGDWPLALTITEPDGSTQTKELTLGVRPISAPQTSSTLLPIDANASVTVDDSFFASYMANTGAMTLAIGPLARLDVPGLLLALDRYPYGCAEQVTSRALPLLYLNDVARLIGTAGNEDLNNTVTVAIANLLSKQNSGGGFGLWGPFDGGDGWLDAFVTDFLLRAQAAGYAVPEQAMSRALDNLSNQLAYASDFDNGGEDVAYALYNLARAGRVSMGDLRYYLEARLDAFGSPLAQAQLGAALALYGDQTRAATAFAAALDSLNASGSSTGYRADYGSRLRDTAGVLALAAEFKPAGFDLDTLANQLAKLRDRAQYTSTQDDSWTLLAAAALGEATTDGTITINGQTLTGSVYRRFEQLGFTPLEIANQADTPTQAKVSVTGYPANQPDAASNGFILQREYFLPDGTPIDPQAEPIAQNERLVVVLTAWPDNLGSGQYVLADPLPAGFEIENANLSAGGVADFNWLQLDNPVHIEARTDQYVAAFRYYSDPGSFATAYLVRAVSPGSFTQPGATVEDMYRPQFRANTDAGTIEVTATGP